MKNPHKKGTMAYLDFATKQHDKATAPKKPMAKKKMMDKKPATGGLAGRGKIDLGKAVSDEQKRRGFFKNVGGGQ